MSDSSSADISVLHVEDDPDFADLTATLLERESDQITVRSVTTPAEGLEMVAEHEIDCIVSDYDLPEMTGLQFLETIRNDHPNLPFILYTGKGSEEVASDAISAGVTDYLQKSGGTNQYTLLANRITNAVAQFRAEQSVTRTREYFAKILEQSSDYMMVVGKTGRIEYISPSVTRVMGYSVTDVTDADAFEFIHPDDLSRASDTFSKVISNPDTEHAVEYRARHADGSWRWLEVRGRNALSDPVIEGIIVNVRDITEKKTSRLQLETVIDNLPGYVYRHRNEPGWPLEFVRGSAEAVTGYTTAELEDKLGLAEDVIHPADKKAVRTAVETALETTGRFDIEYRIITKDGQQREIRDQGQLLDDRITDVTVIDGFVTDITEQKEREQRLLESSTRLEALFNQSPDMINIHDIEGRITESNPRFIEKTGYEKDELVGMYVWELDHTAKPETVRTIWEEMEYGERRRLEGVYKCRDGSTFPVEVHIRRLSLAGEDRFIVISRDITDRVKRERRLKEQNERLAEFAGVVSHDLRNPLNVAQLRLSLARSECENEHLETVARAHERMESLMDDLLTLAREGNGMAEPEPTAIAAFATECWKTVETDSATIAVDVSRTVMADTSRLKQVFENLFRNAVEHSGDGVTVTVGELADGFYIEDDGSGIPESDREAVFEAGYSTTQGGTGFGLSIVKQIVDAHGWDIRVTEGTDGGARFEITGVTVIDE